MISLGVDTSSALVNIGLADGMNLIGEISIGMEGKYLKNLLPSIHNLLTKTRITILDIDLFIVVLGPGSWTGIRVGVATMKSIAHTLKKPIVGICTLDVLAYNLRFSNYPVYTVVDAARRNVYFAGYMCNDGTPQRFSEYKLDNINNLLDSIELPAVVLGDGFINYRSIFEAHKRKNEIITTQNLNHTRGAFVVEAGLNKYHDVGSDDAASLVPLYLQKSDAERVWEKRRNNWSEV